MRIFKKMFGVKIKQNFKNKIFNENENIQNDLREISSKIITGLTFIRLDFLNNCQQVIKNLSKERCVNILKDKEIECMIIAYQLNGVINFMPGRKYVKSDEEGDFLKNLTSKINKDFPKEQLRPYFSRYYTPLSSHYMPHFITQTFRFCSDIIDYIIGETSNSLADKLRIFPLATQLEFMTKVIVANAFGDKEGSNQLEKNMKQELNEKFEMFFKSVNKQIGELNKNKE